MAPLSARHTARRNLCRVALPPHIINQIEHRTLDYPSNRRIAPGEASKPVRFRFLLLAGDGLFLRHPHGEVHRKAPGHLGHGRGDVDAELRALHDAGCRLDVQIEEPTSASWPTRTARTPSSVKFIVDAYDPEVEELDDVEISIDAVLFGNPDMQRMMEDASYTQSIEMYLEACRGDVWNTRDEEIATSATFELFEPRLEGDQNVKKICLGASQSPKSLQPNQPQDVAGRDSGRRESTSRPEQTDVRVERLRLRTPGLQPRDRVLPEGRRDRTGCDVVRRELGFPVARRASPRPTLAVRRHPRETG